MRSIMCLLTTLAFTAGVSGEPQSATADGILALGQGDFQSAVRILKPLAEESSAPDPIAQYFMALLYDTGRGVALNPIRACALFLAAATPPNPFADEARARARRMQERAPVMNAMCIAQQLYGWVDPPSTAFRLAPDKSVAIDRTGFTVRVNDTSKHTAIELGGPGFAYLPVRRTALDVSRPIEGRRDFIEFFMWYLTSVSGDRTWTLGWSVHEVVGLDVGVVKAEWRLKSIAAAQPPQSFDPSSVARLQIGVTGEAEWIIQTDSSPQRGVIPVKGPQR